MIKKTPWDSDQMPEWNIAADPNKKVGDIDRAATPNEVLKKMTSEEISHQREVDRRVDIIKNEKIRILSDKPKGFVSFWGEKKWQKMADALETVEEVNNIIRLGVESMMAKEGKAVVMDIDTKTKDKLKTNIETLKKDSTLSDSIKDSLLNQIKDLEKEAAEVAKKAIEKFEKAANFDHIISLLKDQLSNIDDKDDKDFLQTQIDAFEDRKHKLEKEAKKDISSIKVDIKHKGEISKEGIERLKNIKEKIYEPFEETRDIYRRLSTTRKDRLNLPRELSKKINKFFHDFAKISMLAHNTNAKILRNKGELTAKELEENLLQMETGYPDFKKGLEEIKKEVSEAEKVDVATSKISEVVPVDMYKRAEELENKHPKVFKELIKAMGNNWGDLTDADQNSLAGSILIELLEGRDIKIKTTNQSDKIRIESMKNNKIVNSDLYEISEIAPYYKTGAQILKPDGTPYKQAKVIGS